MYASENVNTARMKGGCRREALEAWMTRSADILDAHPGYPSYELEKSLGHQVLAGEIDAQAAYNQLGLQPGQIGAVPCRATLTEL